MKTGWNGEALHGMQDLPEEEARKVCGGESLWYWISYGVGDLIYHTILHPAPQSSGQKLMNAALG